MKKIFILLSVLISITAFGQVGNFYKGYLPPNTQQTFLGTIYQASNPFASTSHFTASGGTVSVSSGALLMGGGVGASDYVHTVDFHDTSLVEREKKVMKFRINATGAGVGIGIKSINTSAQDAYVGSVSFSTGTVHLATNVNGVWTTVGTSATNITYSVGDTIYLTVERKVDSIYATAWNKTQNIMANTSYGFSWVYGATQFMPNTGVFSVYEFGGSQLVDSIGVTSQEIVNAQVCFLGDSKVVGYYGGSLTGRFAAKYGIYNPTTIVFAGGGNKTADIIAVLPQLKKLRPKQVFMAIGCNDPRFGVPNATFQANYIAIYDSLLSWGIQPIISLQFFETAEDLSGQVSWQLSTFNASIIVDTWTPLKTNPSGLLAADGAHPNAAGHDSLYKVFLNSFIAQGGYNPVVSGSIISIGADMQVPFNNSGILVAGSNFTFNYNTNVLNINGLYSMTTAANSLQLEVLKNTTTTSAAGIGINFAMGANSNYVYSVAPGYANGWGNGLILQNASSGPIVFFATSAEAGRVNGSNGHWLLNTTTDNSTLTDNGSFATALVSKATSYNIGANDYTILVTATGQTMTLPTAVGVAGRIYTIKLTSTGSCTVATTSSQNIDGATTYAGLSAQYKYVTVQSDGTQWWVTANN